MPNLTKELGFLTYCKGMGGFLGRPGLMHNF